MKKLWTVTELFYPEETSTAFILTKIANALSDKFDVNVICGPESYGRAALEDNPSTKLSLDGRIKIHRVSNCNLNKDKIFTRLLRFLIIGFKLSFSLWKNAKKQDRVFIVTNPAPLLISVALIKRIKKFPLYILVHDVLLSICIANLYRGISQCDFGGNGLWLPNSYNTCWGNSGNA